MSLRSSAAESGEFQGGLRMRQRTQSVSRAGHLKVHTTTNNPAAYLTILAARRFACERRTAARLEALPSSDSGARAGVSAAVDQIQTTHIGLNAAREADYLPLPHDRATRSALRC
jgi:N-acyl-D-aspartate/D-glutamate deacylase